MINCSLRNFEAYSENILQHRTSSSLLCRCINKLEKISSHFIKLITSFLRNRNSFLFLFLLECSKLDGNAIYTEMNGISILVRLSIC